MKVLVCGSRGWRDGSLVRKRLFELPRDSIIIHGYADWKSDGKRAGILRNLAMLNEEPDLVIAFWDGKSPGTKHIITEAKRRGVPVEIEHLPLCGEPAPDRLGMQ